MKKIRKVSQIAGLVGKILNTHSTSNKDAYSCDYINNLNDYEKGTIETGLTYEKFGKIAFVYLNDYSETTSPTTGWTPDVTLPFSISNEYLFSQVYNNTDNNLAIVQIYDENQFRIKPATQGTKNFRGTIVVLINDTID